MNMVINVFTAVAFVTVACAGTVTPRDGKFCSAGTEFSVVPDPADCSQYFRCLDNKYYVMQCADGLRFNGEESYCDYEQNVKCDTSRVKDKIFFTY